MSCYNTKIIDAPLAKVWQTMRNFHDLSWAKGVVETCEKLGPSAGDQLGARRKINGVFVETLLGLDDDAHVIKYSIDEGPPPVASAQGYIGQVRVFEHSDGDQTFVQWSSSWRSADGGVKELCDTIYRALLAALAANCTR